jgi:hypothetical protein
MIRLVLLAAFVLIAGVAHITQPAQPAPKWWAAVVTKAPSAVKLYGPFRGEHGQAKAVNECMRLQVGNPRFGAEGWKCEAMPIRPTKGGK